MSLAELKRKATERSDEIAKAKENNGRKFIPVTFLPAGTHMVRIVPDCESELTSEQYYHKITKAVKCESTDYDNTDGACPICSKVKEGTEAGIGFDYNNFRSRVFKVYMYLIKTDKPGDYWKPGQLYCVIVNKKVNDAIYALAGMLANTANPDAAFEMFNPVAQNQPSIALTFTRGTQGSCNIAPNQFDVAPVLDINALVGKPELPPLAEQYINNRLPADANLVNESLQHLSTYITNKVAEQSGVQQTAPEGIANINDTITQQQAVNTGVDYGQGTTVANTTTASATPPPVPSTTATEQLQATPPPVPPSVSTGATPPPPPPPPGN